MLKKLINTYRRRRLARLEQRLARCIARACAALDRWALLRGIERTAEYRALRRVLCDGLARGDEGAVMSGLADMTQTYPWISPSAAGRAALLITEALRATRAVVRRIDELRSLLGETV